MSDLEQKVRNTIPRCLSLMAATPRDVIASRDCVATAFGLRQKGGTADTAQVLGYLLADYNSDCEGPTEFIGPLSLRWPDSTVDLVFDSDLHGYHGEMDASAKLRGVGEAKAFACTQCGSRDSASRCSSTTGTPARISSTMSLKFPSKTTFAMSSSQEDAPSVTWSTKS